MDECDICKKKSNSESIKICCKCNLRICDECSYYSGYYRQIKEDNMPDIEINEENYFCEIHFVELVKGFSAGFLEEMLAKNFLIQDKYNEDKQVINYIREFKGKNLRKIVSDAIPEWPSDEWKDWNTM
jgi:hypothetical protein